MSEHWSSTVSDLKKHLLAWGKPCYKFHTDDPVIPYYFLKECMEKILFPTRGKVSLEGCGFSIDFMPTAIRSCSEHGQVSVVGNNSGGDESFAIVEVILDPVQKFQQLTVLFYRDLDLPAIMEID